MNLTQPVQPIDYFCMLYGTTPSIPDKARLADIKHVQSLGFQFVHLLEFCTVGMTEINQFIITG